MMVVGAFLCSLSDVLRCHVKRNTVLLKLRVNSGKNKYYCLKRAKPKIIDHPHVAVLT